MKEYKLSFILDGSSYSHELNKNEINGWSCRDHQSTRRNWWKLLSHRFVAIWQFYLKSAQWQWLISTGFFIYLQRLSVSSINPLKKNGLTVRNMGNTQVALFFAVLLLQFIFLCYTQQALFFYFLFMLNSNENPPYYFRCKSRPR